MVSAPPAARRRDRLAVSHQCAAHSRDDAVLGEFAEIDLVDPLILVGVLDLPAAIAHTDIDPHEEVALLRGEGIAQAAQRHGEVTAGAGPRLELFMSHPA